MFVLCSWPGRGRPAEQPGNILVFYSAICPECKQNFRLLHFFFSGGVFDIAFKSGRLPKIFFGIFCQIL